MRDRGVYEYGLKGHYYGMTHFCMQVIHRCGVDANGGVLLQHPDYLVMEEKRRTLYKPSLDVWDLSAV